MSFLLVDVCTSVAVEARDLYRQMNGAEGDSHCVAEKGHFMSSDFSYNSCFYIFTKDAFFTAKSKDGLV